MTIEQIIDRIGELGGYASAQGWDDKYREATILAIEILKQKAESEVVSNDD